MKRLFLLRDEGTVVFWLQGKVALAVLEVPGAAEPAVSRDHCLALIRICIALQSWHGVMDLACSHSDPPFGFGLFPFFTPFSLFWLLSFTCCEPGRGSEQCG